ncbi:MAG: VWA domain-containing protein [Candidatus Liptonbacteria bacterium]|nr:VWA domain-containing protein [Candidatus Liptonbacteria bacterium]
MLQVIKSEKFPHRSCSTGQTMISTVLTISSVLLGLAILSASLLIFQLRQAKDASNYSAASAAADSGAEWYFENKIASGVKYDSTTGLLPTYPPLSFSNGSSFEVEALSDTQAKITGRSGSSIKVIYVSLSAGNQPNQIPCSNADIMIVIDLSLSMSSRLSAIQAAANKFIDNLDSTKHKVGLVTFYDDNDGSLYHLTSVFGNIKTDINNLTIPWNRTDQTDLAYAGITRAQQELASGYDQPDATSPDFMVIFTDGNVNADQSGYVTETQARANAKTASLSAQQDGNTLFVVGFPTPDPTDAAFLKNDIASSPKNNHFIDASQANWPEDQLLSKIACYSSGSGSNFLTCNSGSKDLEILVDRPSSANLPSLQSGLKEFLNHLDFSVYPINTAGLFAMSATGLTSYNPNPTDFKSDLFTAIDNIISLNNTTLNLSGGISAARSKFNLASDRPDQSFKDFLLIVAETFPALGLNTTAAINQANLIKQDPDPSEPSKEAANVYVVAVGGVKCTDTHDSHPNFYQSISSGPTYCFEASNMAALQSVLVQNILGCP